MLSTSIDLNCLKAYAGKRIAFYQSMEGTPSDRYRRTSPSTLQFIAWLEKMGHKVDYFIYARELEKGIAGKKYDVVAISAAEPDFKNVYEVSSAVKSTDPGVIVAVGGYVTAGIGKILVQHPAIDAAFEGEAEYTFPLFLREAKRSDGSELAVPVSDFYGIKDEDLGGFPFKTYYRSPIDHETAGRIMGSSFRRVIGEQEIEVPIGRLYIKTSDGSVYFPQSGNPDLVHSVAPLAAELDNMQDLPWWTTYSRHQSGGLFQDFFSTQGSALSWKDVWLYIQRGCAGNKGEPCGFCSIPYSPRFPSVDAAIETVAKTIRTFEHQEPPRMPQYVRFGDESFTQNRAWALEFLRRLRENDLSPKLGFSMQSRVVDGFREGRIDEELLDALAEAHFDQAIGIESLHPSTIEYLGKVSEGMGRKYAEMAHEYVIESLKRNVPTTAYAITAHPVSTLDTIADDYVAWSELARHAYESTGRVPRIAANTRLMPHKATRIGREEMDCEDIAWAEADGIKRMRAGNVMGDFYPVSPAFSARSLGVFVPSYCLFDRDVMEFLPYLERACARPGHMSLSDFADYIDGVGYSLWEYADAKRKKGIGKKSKKILDNMTVVIEDKKGYRQKRVQDAEKLFHDALYRGRLEPKGGMLDFEEVEENIRRRFENPYAQLGHRNDLESLVDTIASRNPGRLAEYSRTRTGMRDDGFFNITMQQFYRLLTDFGYDFTRDSTNARLDKARKAISELMHASSIFSENHDAQIGMMLQDMQAYPLKAGYAKELYENGFPLIWPSGFCVVDEAGVRTFV